jgi:hypothetical protein
MFGSIVSSSPGKGGYYSLESKYDKNTARRTILSVLTTRLQAVGRNLENLFWVPVVMKIVVVSRQKNENTKVFLWRGITGAMVTNPQTFMSLSLRKYVGFRIIFPVIFHC